MAVLGWCGYAVLKTWSEPTSCITDMYLSCRQTNGIESLVQLVRAGPRNQAAVCAASALANTAANNGINQQQIAACGGVEVIVDLLTAACQLQSSTRCGVMCFTVKLHMLKEQPYLALHKTAVNS